MFAGREHSLITRASRVMLRSSPSIVAAPAAIATIRATARDSGQPPQGGTLAFRGGTCNPAFIQGNAAGIESARPEKPTCDVMEGALPRTFPLPWMLPMAEDRPDRRESQA